MEKDKLPRLMTVRELSQETGIARYRLYELSRAGKIPHIRLGRAVRYDPGAVKSWLSSGKSTKASSRISWIAC